MFGECAYVAWGWSEELQTSAPQPFDDTDTLIELLSDTPPAVDSMPALKRDEEQAIARNVTLADIYAQNLTTCIAGYRNKLGNNHRNIHLVAIDSASTGCMSLVLDREIESSRLLDTLAHWHLAAAWIQNFGSIGKGKVKSRRQFIGAPSPEAIAWLVCGRNPSKKHVASTVNRILPVIIDGSAFPEDIVKACVARVFHRSGMEHWEWEKALGIACSLYRYTHKERKYQMEMELDQKSRDYLWGCLLALAEVTERYSLEKLSQENRSTNAERLFARFAEQPFATWTNIELALQPSLTRLASGDKLAQWIGRRFKEHADEIMKEGFEKSGLSYTDNSRLSGEFLLGYHCQRHDLYKSKKPDNNQTPTTETEEQDHE
jgi:CRISPR-associated protein Csd1